MKVHRVYRKRKDASLVLSWRAVSVEEQFDLASESDQTSVAPSEETSLSLIVYHKRQLKIEHMVYKKILIKK